MTVERKSTLLATCETFIEAENEAEAGNIAMRNAEAGEYAWMEGHSSDEFDSPPLLGAPVAAGSCLTKT